MLRVRVVRDPDVHRWATVHALPAVRPRQRCTRGPEGRPQRSLPVRIRAEVQEVLWDVGIRRDTVATMIKLSRAPLAAIAALIIAGCDSSTAVHSAHPPGWGFPPKGAEVIIPPTQSLSNTGRMYDTVTISMVPPDPFATAGYTSGFFPTFEPLRRSFPHSHTISIAINVDHEANCLDVEPGDATPSQVPGWVRVEKDRGAMPCVYSSWWEFTGEVRPILLRAGIARSAIFEWDANYLGCPRLDATFDATQCTNTALGRNLDESVVKLSFLSIATPPFEVPKPPSKSLLREYLGAYSKRTNPHGHNCQHPPYKHAYPSARYDRACAAWAREVAR